MGSGLIGSFGQWDKTDCISIVNMFGYYYLSVNGISYGLAQIEPIKRRPL